MFDKWLENKDPELHMYLEMAKKKKKTGGTQLAPIGTQAQTAAANAPVKIVLGKDSVGHGYGQISGGGAHKNKKAYDRKDQSWKQD